MIEGSEDTLYYSAAELEQAYADARDSLIATVDRDELQEKYLLIAGAARGSYSPPADAAADAGSLVVGCLAFDQDRERYRKVILTLTGDVEVTNLTSEAAELDTWLRNITQQFPPYPRG